MTDLTDHTCQTAPKEIIHAIVKKENVKQVIFKHLKEEMIMEVLFKMQSRKTNDLTPDVDD